MYSVIIPAAGMGSRMGLSYNKVLKHLLDKPILLRTMEIFLSDNRCTELILVISKNDTKDIKDILDKYNITNKVKTVYGGETRLHSVYNGVKEATNDIVLIHDGARPFLSNKVIDEVVISVLKHEAVIVGVPVKDTVKKVNNGDIVDTPNRGELYLAQTPQAFKTDLILDCYKKAINDKVLATDDSQLVEMYSKKVVKIINGEYTNIKLTTPEDLLLGEAILKNKADYMDINIRKIDLNSDNDFEALEKWGKDETINQFFIPRFTEEPIKPATKEMLKQWAIDDKHTIRYMIDVDDQPIGELTIQIDPDHLHKKEKDTSWISIVIGEPEYRGKGIAKKAIEFLEEESKKLNLKRIELGVFEFNERAIKFYEKMGYEKIAKLENFTYHHGEWRSDYRYEKYLRG